jgi:hypothetical protein
MSRDVPQKMAGMRLMKIRAETPVLLHNGTHRRGEWKWKRRSQECCAFVAELLPPLGMLTTNWLKAMDAF